MAAIHNQVMATARPAAAGSSYWLEEGFEGTGAPSGWTALESSSPDWDSTVSPLAGAQSLRVGFDQALFTHGSDHSTFTFHCLWRPDDLHIGDPFVFFRDSGGTVQARVIRDSAGVLKAYHGTTPNGFGGTYAADTTYHLWIRYTAQSGGGGNGTLELWNTTSSTRPGSPDISITTGTGTAIRQVGLSAWNFAEAINDFDDVRASDSDFTT
jgi:hypothetical protein